MIPQLTTFRSIDSAILQGEVSSVSLADRRVAALGYLNRICWSRLLSRKEVARKQGFEVYKKKETIEWRFTEGSWANPRRLARWAARYRRKRVELNDRSYETGSKIPSLRFETRLPSGSR